MIESEVPPVRTEDAEREPDTPHREPSDPDYSPVMLDGSPTMEEEDAIYKSSQPVNKEIRFFAGLRRYYTADQTRTKYKTCRWLKRLCVLKIDNGQATLSAYKSRKSWYKFWQCRGKKGSVNSGKHTELADSDLKSAEVTGILEKTTPCRVLKLELPSKDEIQKIMNDKRTTNKSKWSENQIIVKGKDENKYKGSYTPYQVWVLSVYDMESNADVVTNVCEALRNANLLPSEDAEATLRRRLPGESFLEQLRVARPYRDSPVLTRLLKKIREASQQ